MKKVLVVLALSLFAVAGFAQKGKMYIGTSTIGFSGQGYAESSSLFMTGFLQDKEGGVKTTMFGINPEVGYYVSDNFSVALGVAFGSRKADGDADATITLGLNPYARYYVCTADKFSFYLQGGVEWAQIKTGDTKGKYFGVGVNPGVAYNLSDSFGITAAFGYAGYQDFGTDSNVFGLNLNMSSLRFGLNYKF